MHRLVKVPIYPMYLCDLFFADAALWLIFFFLCRLFFFPHRPLRLLEGLLAPGCAKKALGHFHTFFRWKVEAATDRKRKRHICMHRQCVHNRIRAWLMVRQRETAHANRRTMQHTARF